MKSSSFASSSQRSYTSARLRSRTVGSSPTTTSSMIASDMPTGRSARRALIASRAATWPALMPSANASISSGSITFARRYARHAGLAAARLEGRALDLADEVGQVQPAQQPGQVGLVHRDGVRDPVAEPLHHAGRSSGRTAPGASGSSHELRLANQCGEVKWLKVTSGARPAVEALVDDRLVVVERRLVEDALLGLHAGPLHREAVRRHAHRLGQRDVLAPEHVAVARLARRLLEHRRRHQLGEPGVAVAVVALGLVAGPGHTPEEPVGKVRSLTRTANSSYRRSGTRGCRYLASGEVAGQAGWASLRRTARPSFFSWLPRLRRLVSSSQPSGNDRRRTRCQAEPTCRTSGRVL